MSFPAIVNQNSFIRDPFRMIDDGCGSSVLGSRNIRGQFALPSPEPMCLAINFHTCFVSTEYRTFYRKLADHLLKPFEWQMLPDAQITHKTFHIPSITHWPINTSRKITFNDLSTATRATVNPVLSDNLFDLRNLYHLPLTAYFKRQFADIVSTSRAKTSMVIHHYIRMCSHLKSFGRFSSLDGGIELLLLFFRVSSLSSRCLSLSISDRSMLFSSACISTMRFSSSMIICSGVCMTQN